MLRDWVVRTSEEKVNISSSLVVRLVVFSFCVTLTNYDAGTEDLIQYILDAWGTVERGWDSGLCMKYFFVLVL